MSAGDSWPKRFSVPTRSLLVVLSLLAILPLSVVTAVLALSQVDKPFPGFLMQPGAYLSPYQRPSWSGYQAGLRPEDVVLRIDGKAVRSAADVTYAARTQGFGKTLTVEVNRKGKRLVFRTPVAIYTWADFFVDYVAFLAFGLIYAFVGVLSVWLRPGLSAARAMWLAGLATGAFCITYLEANSTHYLTSFCNVCIAMMGGVFLYLAFTFPERLSLLRRINWPVWLSAALTVLIATLGVVGNQTPAYMATSPERFEASYALIRLPSSWASLGMLAFILLIPAQFLSTKPRTLQRQQVQICSSGAVVAFGPLAVCWGLPFLAKATPLITLDQALLPIGVFPLVVAYAIIRHHLFDATRLIRRGLVYGALTLILGTTYAAVSALIGGAMAGGDARTLWAGVASTASVLAVFLPLRDQLQRQVDRILFPKLLDTQEFLARVTRKLATTIDFFEIADFLCAGAKEACNSHARLFVLQGTGELTEVGGNSRLMAEIVALAGDPRAFLCREPLFLKQQGIVCPDLEKVGGNIGVFLKFQDRVEGLLVLEEKEDGRSFMDGDFRILEVLANEGALALHSARRVRELQETRDSLAHAEKLASLGMMASGVVHELSTPIAVLRGQLEINRDNLESSFWERLSRQVEKMDGVVGGLLLYGRSGSTGARPIAIAPVVASAIEALSLAERAFSRVTVETRLPSLLPAVVADPSKLEQVFLNVLKNALHALEGSSDPVIRISVKDDEDNLIIRVEDNGRGMDEPTLVRAFEPFFTTKPQGRGAGLGLAVCREILREFGGSISAESHPDRGTSINISFPDASRS